MVDLASCGRLRLEFFPPPHPFHSCSLFHSPVSLESNDPEMAGETLVLLAEDIEMTVFSTAESTHMNLRPGIGFIPLHETDMFILANSCMKTASTCMTIKHGQG